MFQMKQDKITAKELTDTEIINMLDREFKVIIVEIFTNLKKKWGTSNRPLRKKQKIENPSKMKNSTDKIKIHWRNQ